MSTFGLVHGGGFGAWCWEQLLPKLVARGRPAATVDLTPLEQAAGAAHCASVVSDAFADLDDLVLMGHSGAGLIIPLVATECPVERLIFLRALLPRPGQSVVDQLRSEPEMFHATIGPRSRGPSGRTRRWRTASCSTTVRRRSRARRSDGCARRPGCSLGK